MINNFAARKRLVMKFKKKMDDDNDNNPTAIEHLLKSARFK